MRTRAWASVAVVAALVGVLPAAAQFAKPADAVQYRKSAFSVMGTHFGRIGAMVQGKVPFDAKAAQENAEVVAMLSRLPFHAFPPGTDTGDTKARPEVWQQVDKFKAAASKMQEEVGKLNAAAKTGKLDTIKGAFGPTADSCKACHDDFRKK